jgi:hypothetical protein
MSEKNMMIVEGMKTLGIIEKKMNNNTRDIQRYASQVSTERPLFETEDKQKRAIKELTQSNVDLMQRYLHLKTRVEYSNLMTTVEMGGVSYSISELLVIQRKLAAMMLGTYNALNDTEGQSRLRLTSQPQTGETPHVVRFFREEDKRDQQRVWQDLIDNIITRLEVINATTPLLDLPSKS